VENGTFTTSPLGRVGLFEETELFAGTTYSSTDSSGAFGGEQLSGSSESGFGDVRLGRPASCGNELRPRAIGRHSSLPLAILFRTAKAI